MLLASLLLMLGLTGAILYTQWQADQEMIEGAGTSDHADHSKHYFLRDGVRYPVKRNLTTVLFIGTDSFSEDKNRLIEGENRNRDLADFLMLLVIDDKAKTVRPLQLNRDTICAVTWLDEQGAVGGHRMEHLTFAHSYGSGGKDSCVNTVRTVRELLFDAPINYYFAFTMDAVPILNDAVGGVTITLTEDMPDLGKDYTANAQIILRGDDALRFIRYREHTGGSNYYRMKRHQQYLYAFADAARAAGQRNSDIVLKTFDKIAPYLCTNMSVENITRLYEQLKEYTLCDTLTPSGEIRPGPDFYEMYLNEDSLWNCVYTCYCVK